jgi:uncharacterized protein
MRRLSTWYSALVVAAAVAMSAAAYSRLPERVPIHWGMSGEADRWGSRFEGALLFPFVMLGAWLLLRVLPRIDPRAPNYAKMQSTYDFMINAVMTVLLAVHAMVLAAGLGYAVPVGRITPVLVGALFVTLGNVLPRARPNWWFRHPHAVDADERPRLGPHAPRWRLRDDGRRHSDPRGGGAARSLAVRCLHLRRGDRRRRPHRLLLHHLAKGDPRVINRLAHVVLVLTAAFAPAAAQTPAAPPGWTTFVVTQAGDTLAVERVTRTAARLESDLVVRGYGLRWQFSLALTPEALASTMQNTVRMTNANPEAPPAQAGTLAFRGDSVIAEITMPTRTTQRFATTAGALPFVNLSAAIAEQLVRRARVLGGARAVVPVFVVDGGRTAPAEVTWATPDTAVIMLGGVELRVAVAADGRLLGAIVPAQRVRFTRVDGNVPVAAGPPPDYSAPPGAPYTAEDVTLRGRTGLKLAGTLTVPKSRGADGRVPAVVMITGSGSQNRDEELPGMKGYRFFRQIADTLSRRGIAVLRLDDRGVGGSEAGKDPATSADFADDVRSALEYLRERPDIHGDRLGLVGHSEGGLIAPLVARDDPRVRAIALLAGPSRAIRRILEFQRRVFVENDTTIPVAKRDSAIAAMARAADSAAATPGWLGYVYDYDPLATARRVRTPVLILHGATDLQVTADQALELSSAFHEGGNRDVTIHVFSKTNHLFLEDASGVYSGYATLPSKTVKPEILGTLADWVVIKLEK